MGRERTYAKGGKQTFDLPDLSEDWRGLWMWKPKEPVGKQWLLSAGVALFAMAALAYNYWP